MDSKHNSSQSNDRLYPSARRKKGTQNLCAVGDKIAVLFCPAANGKVFGVSIDKEDLERVRSRAFWRITNVKGKRGFLLYCIGGGGNSGPFVYLHRFVMGATSAEIIDHLHHRTLDNRKSELRRTDYSGNGMNKRLGLASDNHTKLRGVYRLPHGRFRAMVHKNKHLGVFDTPEEASAVVRDFLTANDALHT